MKDVLWLYLCWMVYDYFSICVWERHHQFFFSNFNAFSCDLSILYIFTQITPLRLRAGCIWASCCKSFAGGKTDFSHFSCCIQNICILRHITLTLPSMLRTLTIIICRNLKECSPLFATALHLLSLSWVSTAGSVSAPGKFALRATKGLFFLSFH